MRRLTLPLTISLVLAAVYISLRVSAPDLISPTAFNYLLATLLAAISVTLIRVVNRFLFDVVFPRRSGREAPALLRGLLSFILYVVAFLVIYRTVLHTSIGFEILATSTVLSVILGLALQDTLGNFFAGISLHVEQPFHILDAIRIGDMLGKVESVTWRTTTLRTNNNSLIVFPNSRVAREPIEIYSFDTLNRRVLPFPAPYSVRPEIVISLVRDAVRSLPEVAPEKTPVVRINSFSDSYVTYEVLYWVKDYMLTSDLDTKIRERIWYVYRRNGIDIPYPIHLLVENFAPSKADAESVESMIESVDLFDPLSTEEKRAIAEAAVGHVFAPGELILRQGDAGESMFIVRRGSVEVRLASSNGEPLRVATLEQGSVFGEMCLLTGEPRSADVSAVEEVEVLEIRKSALQQLLNDNSQLAIALSDRVAERHSKLVEFSRSMAEEEKRMHKESILRRVQRFFGLNQRN